MRNSHQTLFLEAMASCTEVTYVDGHLVGDPLDVKMFQSTGWTLTECAVDDKQSSDQNIVLAYVQPTDLNSESFKSEAKSEVDFNVHRSYVSAIVRRFEFSSAL